MIWKLICRRRAPACDSVYRRVTACANVRARLIACVNELETNHATWSENPRFVMNFGIGKFMRLHHWLLVDGLVGIFSMCLFTTMAMVGMLTVKVIVTVTMTMTGTVLLAP